jgi:hypothetical protein
MLLRDRQRRQHRERERHDLPLRPHGSSLKAAAAASAAL